MFKCRKCNEPKPQVGMDAICSDCKKQVNASIPVGFQGTGAQDTGGIDLQKLAELINRKYQRIGGFSAFTTSGWPLNVQRIEWCSRDLKTLKYDRDFETVPFYPDDSGSNALFLDWGLSRLGELVSGLYICHHDSMEEPYMISWHDDVGATGKTIYLTVAHALVLALSEADQKQEPIYDPATFKGVNEFGICEDCGVGENGLCPPCATKKFNQKEGPCE